MAPSSKLPLFGRSASDSLPPSVPMFAAPNNVSSNGLFSPSPPQRSKSAATANSLFAGATPGTKPSVSRLGTAPTSIFTKPAPPAASAPKFAFNAPAAQGPSKLSRPPMFGEPQSKPAVRKVSISRQERYSSPSDGDDEDDMGGPRIYEDDSIEDATPQDESADSGMYGDDEDVGDVDYTDDTVEQGEVDDEFDYEEGMGDETPIKRVPYRPDIQPGIIHEPNSLILTTEELMEGLHQTLEPMPIPSEDDDYMDYDDAEMERPVPPPLEKQAEAFAKFSKTFLQAIERDLPKNQQGNMENSLRQAYYVASLVLPLHHSTASTPETLRKWLFAHHANPSTKALHAVKTFHPSCASCPDYWEMLLRLIVRGEIAEVIELLGAGNWDLLSTSAPTSFSKPAFGTQKPIDKRYKPEEVETIKHAILGLRRVVESTPGRGRSSYQPSASPFFPNPAPNIDFPGSTADWRIWRGQVIQAHEEFKRLAGGSDDIDDSLDEDSFYTNYHPTHPSSFGFGIKQQNTTKLPGDIARHLRSIYEILSGDEGAVLAACQQWEEGVVAVTMWCRETETDEEDDEELGIVDIDPSSIEEGEYRLAIGARKSRELMALSSVIEVVVNELPLDPHSTTDIAIGGVFAGDPTFLGELSKLSLLVASVVVEIGGRAEWIERERSSQDEGMDVLSGFDDEELAVLKSAPRDSPYARLAEDILREYASGLFAIEWINEEAEVQGWEVGVGVLDRVNNGKELAGILLARLPTTTNNRPRVDRLLQYCNENRLPDTLSKIAMAYASSLPEDSTEHYGDRLHYYSQSDTPEAQEAIHDLVQKLIAHTLLASAPYPAETDLDPTLRRFLRSPGECESDVVRYEISGYAALRTFYTIRAQEPAAAARALAAVTTSAGEAVDCGNWDDAWIGAVDVKFLGALWAEMLALLARPKVSGPWRFDALRVLGDLETAGANVWHLCETFWEEVKQAAGADDAEDASWVDVAGAPPAQHAHAARRLKNWRMADVVRVLRLRFAEDLAAAWLDGEA